MERFLKRKLSTPGTSSGSTSSRVPEEVDLNDLPWDPSDRKPIASYHPNQKDEIRRKYLIRGPCQPRGHIFPQKMVGNKLRRFSLTWFDQYGNWLEYSVKTDKAFCFCCYLFKDQGGSGSGNEAFVTEGFNGWQKKERLVTHMGDVNSFHNRALKKCQDLLRQDQSIHVAFDKQSDMQKNEHRIRLNTSIDCVRHLLKGTLAFRGHDESDESLFRGHFLETLKLLGDYNETVRNVTLKNAPGNNQMVAPTIQKDICNCFAQEIIKLILEEIGDDVFALLVDESSDISRKEQMAVVLRYVDSSGIVKERFVGLVHVMDTCALSLKSKIDCLFAEYKLSMQKVRGQGYDGASNMRGEFNGLKSLILRENSSAYYVHCFAHQLQLVVVAISKKHKGVRDFFEMIALVTNVVCASCKRKDMIRESQKERLEDAIGSGSIETGSGLNQEISLTRPGDTRWSSHYKTLMRLVELFSSVVDVLEYVEEASDNSLSQSQASGLQIYFKSYDFVFYLHLMLHILGITDSLSQSLQRKDQDILNAMSLVRSTKQQLQNYRIGGFDSLLMKIVSFCEKYDIEMVSMEDDYVNPKSRRQRTNITNHHYYKFDCFNTVLDMQIQEFGDRFNEVSSELLVCISALNPRNSFRDFDLSKLMRLAEFYPEDFSFAEKMALEYQINHYFDHVREDERFARLNGISDLAKLMVDTGYNVTFYLVYRLLKIALVLPVATAYVERCFSTMKIVKTYLRNKIGDDFLNDCCICAVEKQLFSNVSNDDVIDRFLKMKTRKEQL